MEIPCPVVPFGDTLAVVMAIVPDPLLRIVTAPTDVFPAIVRVSIVPLPDDALTMAEPFHAPHVADVMAKAVALVDEL